MWPHEAHGFLAGWLNQSQSEQRSLGDRKTLIVYEAETQNRYPTLINKQGRFFVQQTICAAHVYHKSHILFFFQWVSEQNNVFAGCPFWNFHGIICPLFIISRETSCVLLVKMYSGDNTFYSCFLVRGDIVCDLLSPVYHLVWSKNGCRTQHKPNNRHYDFLRKSYSLNFPQRSIKS